MYCILNYTRIKPRSRFPQKKSAYFTHPDFSTAKIGKKNAQITRANTVYKIQEESSSQHTDRVCWKITAVCLFLTRPEVQVQSTGVFPKKGVKCRPKVVTGVDLHVVELEVCVCYLKVSSRAEIRLCRWRMNESINMQHREIDSNGEQDSNVRLRATLRGVCLTNVAVEKQYYIFRVCICSLSYRTCNAHAPYCHLLSVRLCLIFPHYLINGMVFGKKDE